MSEESQNKFKNQLFESFQYDLNFTLLFESEPGPSSGGKNIKQL